MIIPTILILVVVFLLGVKTGSTLNKAPVPSGLIVIKEPTPVCSTHAEVTRDNLMIKANEYRLKNNLPQFISNLDLDEYAKVRAEEIASNGSFEANKPHETKYVSLFAYLDKTYKKGQEFNLYSEDITFSNTNTCDALSGFIKSPTHNDTLVSSNKFIGIGESHGYIVFEISN